MVEGYSRSQIVLHWGTVALIALQFILADPIVEAFDASLEGKAVAPSALLGAHIIGGLLIVLATLWRLKLRKSRGVPEVPEGTPFEMKLAKGVHHGLYALLLLTPLTGAIAWFGEIEAMGDLHLLFKMAVVVAVVLHVAGALKQQFIKKNNILDRMRSPR